MWLKTENIQLFKKYPLFFFFFYRYSYLYLNVNRSKVVITICWTMQRSQSVHLICYNKQWLRLAVLTVFTSPCVPQSTLRVRFDHHSLAGEKAWIDLWKEEYKNDRILGQCIHVLCVTVLYSVCRCGSVPVRLYNIVVHTFLYVWEFGWVGGGVMVVHTCVLRNTLL